MRKFLISAAVGSMIAAGGALMIPAHAIGPVPSSGCATDATGMIPGGGGGAPVTGNAGGGADTQGVTCTYTANGTTESYVAATPNTWTITATHLDALGNTVVDGSHTGAPGDVQGSIPAVKGDKVTITISPAMDPSGSVGGIVGGVAAGENPAG